jgi:hypothetical protein
VSPVASVARAAVPVDAEHELSPGTALRVSPESFLRLCEREYVLDDRRNDAAIDEPR